MTEFTNIFSVDHENHRTRSGPCVWAEPGTGSAIVGKLREAGNQDFPPKGLLTRAWLHRYNRRQGELQDAEAYCGAAGSLLDPDAPESAKQVEAALRPVLSYGAQNQRELEPAAEPDTAAAE